MTTKKTKDFKNPMVLQYEALPKLIISTASTKKYQDNSPNKYNDTMEAKWAKDMFKDVVYKKVKTSTTFSAAHTMHVGKGHIEAVSCRHIFPTNPTIEFQNDRSDHFGGSLSIWLEGLKGDEQLQFIIRMTGYNSGGTQIKLGASFPTLYSLVPIEVTGSMDLTLGNVLQISANPQGGLALIKLDVQFKNAEYGSWLFWDVKIKDLNEGS